MTNNNNKWYAQIPNIITLSNLACGVIGVYFAFERNTQMALTMMVCGAIFDFFDGFVARLLKVSGELGKQLDSLADLITFGLLPGVMVFAIQRSLALPDVTSNLTTLNSINWIYVISPIMIPVFSAYRLGKFNIDTRQTTSFIGLPTPANALFFASLIWTLQYTSYIDNILSAPVLLGLTIVFCILLIAELPLFALKFSSFKWKGNEIRYIFLATSLVVLIWVQIPGISAIILIYITLSIISNLRKK